jgi:D-glycero-D-manno-heptose 1,7-bisphosphate phosphatase
MPRNSFDRERNVPPAEQLTPIRQAVILAGGRGMRLRPLTDRLPKPMAPIGGRPFIEYVVEMLRDQGIEEVLFLLGYLPEAIVDHFGDGSRFGLRIGYDVAPVDDETGARLRRIGDRVDPTFLLTYADNYWPAAVGKLAEAYRACGCPAMLTVYRNCDAYTRDNVRVENGRIAVYDKSRTLPELAGVDIGFGVFDAAVLDLIPAGGNPSFEATVYPQLVQAGRLAAFETDHRYYSIGSIDRFPLTETFLERRKTILIDRDGTINARMPRARYVTRWEEWQWIDGAREALAALTAAGYRIIVITNQPGIARGALTTGGLEAIHAQMLREAAQAGGTIDAVFACPHGWDEGCDCRKPAPGLLFEAQRRFNFDLTRSIFIGDDERDGIAATAAGARFVRVSDEYTIAAAVGDLLQGERALVRTS